MLILIVCSIFSFFILFSNEIQSYMPFEIDNTAYLIRSFAGFARLHGKLPEPETKISKSTTDGKISAEIPWQSLGISKDNILRNQKKIFYEYDKSATLINLEPDSLYWYMRNFIRRNQIQYLKQYPCTNLCQIKTPYIIKINDYEISANILMSIAKFPCKNHNLELGYIEAGDYVAYPTMRIATNPKLIF